VVEPNRPGWKRIRRVFGVEVLNEDQTINRDKLGSIIFSNSTLRKKLNSCTHDLILIEIFKELIWCLFKGIIA
jgi:dephospho-CoA kinase